MSFEYKGGGTNNVAEYLAAGFPWVTSSNATTAVATILFPMVTTTILIKNNGSAASGSLRIGYTANGVNGSNYFLVDGTQTLSLDIRTKALFVRADAGTATYSIHAGLTSIPPNSYPFYSGSAVYGTPGAASGSYGYGTSGSQAAGSGLG